MYQNMMRIITKCKCTGENRRLITLCRNQVYQVLQLQRTAPASSIPTSMKLKLVLVHRAS